MARVSPPIPLHDPLVDRNGIVTPQWIYYFTDQGQSVTNSAQRVAAVALQSQTAAIGATSLPVQNVTQGLYRVTTYARITVAAGVSSSLTVTIGWTESGVSLSISGAALTGNTTTTGQSFTQMVLADASSPVTYSTAYASVGVPAMSYRLSIVVERVDA